MSPNLWHRLRRNGFTRVINAGLLAFLFGGVMLISTLAAFASTPLQPDSATLATPEDSLMLAPAPAPVILADDTLFFLSTSLGTFNPDERAWIVSKRLKDLHADRLSNQDNVLVASDSSMSRLLFGKQQLLSLTDFDTIGTGMDRGHLAERYAAIIDSAFESDRNLTSLHWILLRIGKMIIATLALYFLFRLIGFIYRFGSRKIEEWTRALEPHMKRALFGLISSHSIRVWAQRIWTFLRIVSSLILFYFYLSFIFSLFQATQGLAHTLLQYAISPLKFVLKGAIAYVPNIFFIAVIVILTRWLIKFIRRLFEGVEKGDISFSGFYPEWAIPTYKIVRLLVLIFAMVVIFPYIPGSNSPAFKGLSIFVGVLFSLGSTSAISNVVAGTALTYMRPFKVGERVKIADAVGDVVEKTLLVTRIRTIKNVEITIPNSMVLGSHIINFSSAAQSGSLILNTTVTIGYDAPWRQVHELLVSAALITEGVLSDPPPFVLQTALNDFFVSYEINAHTDRPNEMASIYSRLHQNIQDQFNAAGVEIMSSHYSAIRDGNQSTIPEEHLPKDYVRPGFKIDKSS